MTSPKNVPAQAGTPDGYMRNALGHLVPVEMVSELDIARDALVQELVGRAKTLAATIAAFRQEVFDKVEAFAVLSASKYDAPIGGRKGNITLHTYDGQQKLQVARQESIAFDERLQQAKALIDECIRDWAAGSRPEIQVLVQQAFDTDKEGNVNTGRVLQLRRLDIKDERWLRAMDAVTESVQVVGTKSYVRFHERKPGTDEYQAISVDIASARAA